MYNVPVSYNRHLVTRLGLIELAHHGTLQAVQLPATLATPRAAELHLRGGWRSLLNARSGCKHIYFDSSIAQNLGTSEKFIYLAYLNGTILIGSSNNGT